MEVEYIQRRLNLRWIAFKTGLEIVSEILRVNILKSVQTIGFKLQYFYSEPQNYRNNISKFDHVTLQLGQILF